MVTLATKTHDLINKTIQADQGNSYRNWLGRVLPHIGDAYRSDEEGFRSHLGASILGQECSRKIWYSYRWVKRPNFEGRMIRLFNRGHLEEGRVLAALLMIGANVYQQDSNGKQYRISHAGGLVGGSGDGVVVGIPDLPATLPCLLEIKTHSEKSFSELKAHHVKSAKFEHYVQMNTYMEKMGLTICLYIAVNKNTDELYMELVQKDSDTAIAYLERGLKIALMQEPPPKLNNSPGFWKCRFCDEKDVCHNGAKVEMNCRTCEFAISKLDGDEGYWYCRNLKIKLSTEVQLQGCEKYQTGFFFK